LNPASTERLLRAPGRETLSVRDWPLAVGPARAVVLMVHGLGEHSGRYGHVADRLHGWGCAARGFDHHGHGASSGKRGGLPAVDRLVDDLALVIDDTRDSYPGAPLLLLGHSLGGLVAASLVARGQRPVEGLVLSSPALDAGLGPAQRGLIALLMRLAPGLRVGNGLKLKYLSHDAAVVQAYKDDRLCHGRIGARLASFLADEGERVRAVAADWRVPTLLLYAGDDRLVRASGSRAFADAAPRAVVESRCFDEHYHEIFNERDSEPVFAALGAWIQAHFSAR